VNTMIEVIGNLVLGSLACVLFLATVSMQRVVR
jgi:hypothetical protein